MPIPDSSRFSLPNMGEDPHLLLGFRGRVGLEQALESLCRELERDSVAYRRG